MVSREDEIKELEKEHDNIRQEIEVDTVKRIEQMKLQQENRLHKKLKSRRPQKSKLERLFGRIRK